MQPRRVSLSWWAVAAVVLLLGAIAGVRLIQAREGSEGAHGALRQAPAVPVELAPVREEFVQDADVLSGQVEPFQVAVVAAEAADRVIERPIRQGDRVSAGQTLAILDSSTAINALQGALATRAASHAAVQAAEEDYLRAEIETAAALQSANAQLGVALANQRKGSSYTRPQELKTAQAALDEALAGERLARLHASRQAFLQQHGVVPQETLDGAQAALDTAVGRRVAAEQALSLARQGARQEDIQAAGAQVDAARAAVRLAGSRDERLAALRRQVEALRAQGGVAAASARQAQLALRRRRVVAPIAGRVLSAPVEMGEMTPPGQPIARIGDISRVRISFAAPEASRPLLKVGQPVSLTVDALQGRHFSGRISTLAYQADPKSRTFPVEVTVDNSAEALLPGMLARVSLPVGPLRRRLIIPTGAVASEGGSSYVYVISGGKAVRHTVTIAPAAGDGVEVQQGLTPSDQVASSTQRLHDGVPVTVVPS